MAMTAAKLRTRVEATKRALRMLESGARRTRVDLFPGAEGEWPAMALRSLKERGVIALQKGYGVIEYRATTGGPIWRLEGGGTIDEWVLELLYPKSSPPVTLDAKTSEEDVRWLEGLGWDIEQMRQQAASQVAPTPEPAIVEAPPPAEVPELKQKLERMQAGAAPEEGEETDPVAAILKITMSLVDHIEWLENRLLIVDGNVKKLLKAWES